MLMRNSGIFQSFKLTSSSSLRKHTAQSWRQPSGHDTGIKVYNCVRRGLVPLVLPRGQLATWYTCGPTVYDSSHLGHASCYVKLDIVQRILRKHFGFNLVTAMNITDIDDKIIAKSHETGQDWREITKFYESEFWSDLRNLNVQEPNVKVRVTENIPKIITFIDEVVKRGNAYVGSDNSVYFKVKAFPQYGKLQRLNLDGDNSSMELESKADSVDFALWKAKKTDHEPSWPSPWGPGRPGWHIECSVLASMVFGRSIDFHAGGLDLKFPHHENEEAQSCVYHDTDQWVNYWLHTGHLNVKGEVEKMSKSLKNTISIEQMLSQYSADDFRMACVLSNYRNSVAYNDELMENSRNTLQKFKSFKDDCRAYLEGKKTGSAIDSNAIIGGISKASLDIDACFKNDFDTARSIAALSEVVANVSRCINASTNSTQLDTSTSLDVVAAAYNFFEKTLQTFGFQFVEESLSVDTNAEANIDLHAFVEDILQSRKAIREKAVSLKNKELFNICDDLRNCFKRHGIAIRDHNQGSSWSFNQNKK